MDLSSKIEKFLNCDTGDGFGFGFGDGFGNGDGYCDGYGDGFGNDDGYCNGYGFGNGDGYCNGYGDGFGDGYGFGNSEGIKKINGNNVHIIDDIPTILTNVRCNIAKGFILEHNVNLKPTYVVKGNGYFAHGETLKKAQSALECKIIKNMNVEEKIKLFIKNFDDLSKKYDAKDFYDWHYKLTGSCEMGRQSFARNHGIDIDKDKLTVNEFIELTENSYCGQIIQQLKKALKEREHND